MSSKNLIKRTEANEHTVEILRVMLPSNQQSSVHSRKYEHPYI